MKDYRDIFSVSREEYKGFVEQIKPECREIKVTPAEPYITMTKIYSKKTNKCLCARETFGQRVENEERQPERYYIFEMPDDDERCAPVPKTKLLLETPQQVQAFFDIVAKLTKKDKASD